MAALVRQAIDEYVRAARLAIDQLVARSAVRELDMSVDDALKYIISMGVVAPAAKPVPPSTPTSR